MNHQRVAELFEQALEVASEERTAWIERACAGDVELRVELERLLRADEHAVDFLERPPALVVDAAAAAREDEPPRQFGAWRVLRQIGSGGMGDVWLGERSGGEFEQRGAIKRLAYPTPGLMQRFRQERQILARLEHPNIARLIDGGVDADGAPYLVMEYVEGVPITDYARDRGLDLRARLQLFLRVCAAVQYAHQNLIVHRDLKPSNILVAADGAPKLLDFGIAKVLATTDAAAQTQTAARLLTPDYAAPEQFSGGAITTATDVYALGVVLYELLAHGRPPRSAPVDANAGAAATEPPPPSAAIDRTGDAAHKRALRGDLDRIALAALAAEPQRRYPSAEALGADIRRYLEGRPISARRDSPWYRLRKFARRNRYAVGAGIAVLVVSVAAAIISLHQAQLARAQAQHASAVQQFMVGVFAQANPDENKGQPISASQLLAKGEEQLARMDNAQPELRVDVTAMLGGLYADTGDFARAESLLKRALAEIGNISVSDDLRGRVLVGLARVEAENKDAFESGMAHARQGLVALERADEKDWEEIAAAQRLIALCLVRLRKDEAAVTLLQEALPLHEAMLAGHPSEALANEWVLLGVALGGVARFDEAEAEFERGAAILAALYGKDSTRYGHALNEEANMLTDKGDLARAEILHRQVLQINRERRGPDNVSTLNSMHNLLGDIEGQGRFAEALPQRLALLEQQLASDQQSTLTKANQYDAVANDYRELGRFAEAEAMARKALAMIEQSQGQRSRRGVIAMRHVALALDYQGRYEEAESDFRDALAILLESGTSTSFVACGLRRDIGTVLWHEHRYTEAIAQLHALTEDACMVGLSESDAWHPQALADLSQAQLDNGDVAAAQATAEQTLDYGHKALQGSYLLGIPLFAMARSLIAMEHAAQAEPLLREALALRRTVHPANDPRILEVQVALVSALTAQKKTDEARTLSAEIEPTLLAANTPYATELRKRMAKN